MRKILLVTLLVFLLSSPAFAQGREEEHRQGQTFSFEVDLTAEVYNIAANRNERVYQNNPFIPELGKFGLFPNNPSLFQAFLQACEYVAPASVEVLNQLEEFKGIITRKEFLEVFDELYNQVLDNQYPSHMTGFSSYASCTHSHIGTGGNYTYSGPNQSIGNLPGQMGMQTSKVTTTWGLNCEYGRMNDPLICSMKIRYSVTQSDSMRQALVKLKDDSEHGKDASEALRQINNTRSAYERLKISKQALDKIGGPK